MLSFILMLIIFLKLMNDHRDLTMKLESTNRRLERMMTHLGIEEESIDEELRVFLRDHKKKTAIEKLRSETGMEYDAAQEYLEALEENEMSK